MEHSQIRIDHTGDRPAVIKEARSGPAVERIRHESVVLQAAQHPGVVTFIACHQDDDSIELRTRFCGSRTLANTAQLPVERIAGIMAALATTVADLHELGLTHGRITADHVLISSTGRPVLCGFAEAHLGADSHARSSDVELLGDLLRELLAPHDDVAPIPDSRLGRRGSWSGYHRRALLNLADQAAAHDPLIRPTARQFAHNIRTTVPGATLLDHDGPGAYADMPFSPDDEPPPPRWGQRWSRTDRRSRSSRLTTVGAGVVGLLSATLVAALVLPRDPSSSAVSTANHHLRSQPTTTSAPRISTTTTTTTAVESDGTFSAPSTDANPEPHTAGQLPASFLRAGGCSTTTDEELATLASGAECPVRLSLTEGVLTVDEQRFALGLDDGAVALGDFTCSDSVDAAVLDRSTGDVYLFTTWASPNQPVSAAALQQVESGSRLLSEPDSAGCHRLVVLDSFGIRHLIDTKETP